MDNPLATYLNDHLSGAKLAIEVLRAMAEHDQGQPLGNFAAALLKRIEADRDTLQGIADDIGGGGNLLKEAGGWLAEKFTRAKLGQTSADDFSTFQALEVLALGVYGKLGLWLALDAVRESDPRLERYDFKQLASGAREQYASVEQQRLAFAKKAFVR